MDEFTLIEHYFASPADVPRDVVLGIGDDAALLALPHPCTVASVMHTLCARAGDSPEALARRGAFRALAALAADGAQPRWATLALSLPTSDPRWLEPFAASLSAALRDYGVCLIGGDTTRGAHALTLTVTGTLSDDPAPGTDGPGEAVLLLSEAPRGTPSRPRTALGAHLGTLPGAIASDTGAGLVHALRRLCGDHLPEKRLLDRLAARGCGAYELLMRVPAHPPMRAGLEQACRADRCTLTRLARLRFSAGRAELCDDA